MNGQVEGASGVLPWLVESVGRAAPGILAGLVVLAGFCGAAVAGRILVRRLAGRFDADKRPLVTLAGETVFYVVLTVGLISSLGTMGIDISALIAGLGLTGFALGFALRDAVSNLIAGVLILLYQPFGYDDEITVGGSSGRVIGINFRYTVLDAGEHTVIHVPNGFMFSNSVKVQSTPGA